MLVGHGLDVAEVGAEVERVPPWRESAGRNVRGVGLVRIPKRMVWLALPLFAIGLAVILGGRQPEAPATVSVDEPATVTHRDAVGVREDPAALPVPNLEAAIVAPGDRVERSNLGRGGTLAAALDGMGIPAQGQAELLAAVGGAIDPRRLPAKTGIVVVRDPRGQPRSFAIRTETERFLRVRLAVGDGAAEPHADWIELPVEVAERVAEGVVQTCVAQALEDLDHGIHLTAAFADVFQWDVDLLVEPRPGDRVRLIYEFRRLGQVPPDVPWLDAEPCSSGDLLPPGRILAAAYSGRIARARAFWVEDDGGQGSYYDSEGLPLRKTFLKSPLNYRRISSGFSHARRHPITRKVMPHHGVDFAAAPGTPVVSTADGRVASAGWAGALGRTVRVRHGSEYETVYGHLSGIARGVRAGTQVRQNQVIGYVGSSGRATGPHLHYSMLRSGLAINPLRFKNPPSEPLPAELLPQLEMAKRRWLPMLGPDEAELELVRGGDPASPGPPGRPGA